MGSEFWDLEIKNLILGDLSKLCAVKTLSYKKKIPLQSSLLLCIFYMVRKNYTEYKYGSICYLHMKSTVKLNQWIYLTMKSAGISD